MSRDVTTLPASISTSGARNFGVKGFLPLPSPSESGQSRDRQHLEIDIVLGNGRKLRCAIHDVYLAGAAWHTLKIASDLTE